jgi:hypothetical protein
MEDNKLAVNIFRKPSTTDIMMHFLSNHPLQHETIAYRSYLWMTHTLPLTQKGRQSELNTTMQVAQNNGFSAHMMQRFYKGIAHKRRGCTNNTDTTQNRKCVTFTYYSPAITKVANMFTNAGLRIAFTSSNTVLRLLNNKQQQEDEYKT